MKLRFLLCSIIFFSFSNASTAQLLQWNTISNAGTETTEPSVFNNADIAAANLTLGAGVTPAGNGNRFGGNAWFTTSGSKAEAISGNDYIQFVVAPNVGFSFTPTSFVFTWDRSGTGPSSVALRSSADGFASDLGTVTAIVSSAFASNTINISGLTNITTATTFRLYGYGATAVPGTGGFDQPGPFPGTINVVLNGTTAPTLTGITSFQDGDWEVGSTWIGGVVPTSAQNVIINHTVTAYTAITRDAGTTTQVNATPAGTLVINWNTYTNNGTTNILGSFQINSGGATGNNFDYGPAGTLIFNTAGNYNLNNTDVFWPAAVALRPFNVKVMQSGITLASNMSRTVDGWFYMSYGGVDGVRITTPGVLLLNGLCQIDTGGFFFGNSPTYGPASTLNYNSAGDYGRAAEWTYNGVGTIGVSPGYPNNVWVTNGTTLNYTNGTPLNKAMAGNLTIDATSSFYMDYGFVTAGGTLTVNGDINCAGNLSLGYAIGDDLRLRGNLWFTGGGQLIGNNRAIFFTNSATQTISSVQPLTIPYVVFQPPSGSKTIQLLSNLNVSAPAAGNVISFGSGGSDIFDINGRTLTIGTIGVANTILNVGTFKGSTTSNLELRGLGSIGNLGFTTGFQNLGTFNSNRQAAVTSCILTTPVTINTSLLLTQGLVNVGNNPMTIAAAATVSGNIPVNSYVIADLANGANAAMRKVFTAAGSFTFPIGDNVASLNGSQYSPITVNFTGGSYPAGSYAGVAVNDIKHPNFDSVSQYITRYWSVATSGVSAPTAFTAAGTYLDIDVNTPAFEANYQGNKWNGTAWSNGGSPGGAATNSTLNVPCVVNTTNEITSGLRDPDINVYSPTVASPYINGSTYNFGSIAIGNSNAVTFTIQNIGQQSLNLSPAATLGGGPVYVYTTPYATGNLSTNSTITFVVTFSPTSTGTFTGSISIPSNDPNETPYIINFTGVGAIPAPEINVQNGAALTLTTGNTPFGFSDTVFAAQVVPTTSAPKTYTIQNLGNVPLNIASVTFAGANPGDFAILTPPAASVAASASTTFSVTFTPTAGGVRTATVVIASNDADEPSYTFYLSGTGQEPEIEVYGFGSTIVDGTTTVSTSNNTQFGNVNVAAGSVTQIFTIFNTGALSLTISGTSLSGPGAGDFTINTFPFSPLASNGSTTLVITFNPSSVGVIDAIVTITNNDSNENPYTFAIQGNGIDYIPCALGASQTIAVQDFEVAPATPTLGYSYTQEAGAGIVFVGGGTAYGASRAVVSNKFIGARSFQVPGHSVTSTTETTTTIDFATIDVSAYQNVSLNFRVGAYSTNTTQGVDGNPEKIMVYISKDNGATWSREIDILGSSNAIWDVNSSSGIGSVTYDGNNIPGTFIAGFNSTNTAVRDITLNNIANVTQLKVRITMTLDRTDELWVIDNVRLLGKTVAISTWNGSAWSPSAPTTSTQAVIAGNYSTTPNGNIQACECQINPTFTLDVSPNNYVEVQSNLTNNGTLNISDDGSLVQINNAAVNSGTSNVTRTTSSYNKFDYTYWSSPVASATIGGPFSLWRLDYAFEFATGNYADVIAPFDGFDDNNDAWQAITGITPMIPAKGYAIMAPTTGSFPATSTVTFTGAVNNGVISLPLAMSGNAGSNTDDFNLIGNPYPSAIFADDFIAANPSFAGTLYFWTHRTGISGSNPGPDQNNFITADYAMYNYSGGVGTGTSSGPGSPTPTGYVASGQGFFVDAQSATSVVFNNSMRSRLYNNSNFYRQSPSTVSTEQLKDRIWLNLQNEQGLFSQQLVGYFPTATLGFDPGFDGVVNPSSNSVSFYSFIDGANYRIQGRPAFGEGDVVPLGFSSNFAGSYSISIDHAEGELNAAETNVFLEDQLLGIIHDLKQSPYIFTTGVGTFDSRFVLRYTNTSLAINETLDFDNQVLAYAEGQNIIIKSENEKLKKVIIYDLLGHILFSDNNIDSSEVIVSQINSGHQVLIISIVTESGDKFIKKIRY